MTNNEKNTAFANFIYNVADESWPLKTTVTGITTIQQTTRNNLRKEGVAALLADLQTLYGDQTFDIVETNDGIVFTITTKDGWRFNWEISSTIKAVDPYDPFQEAELHKAQRIQQEKEKKNKEAAAHSLAKQRASREAKARGAATTVTISVADEQVGGGFHFE